MIHFKQKNESFLVSNYFVDNFLCETNGSFVKVYLYILRHSTNHNLDMSDISNALNLLESDVLRALKYWHKQKLISLSKRGENDFVIEFLNRPSEPVEAVTTEEAVEPVKPAPSKATLPTAVVYTKSELNEYMKNNDGIRHMFFVSEQLLNRTLTETDRKILFGFYDYLGMPIEVIFTLLEYCISNGKSNMRYIEKIAYSWADREINTLAKASKHVKELNELMSQCQKYKKMFRITGRELTPTEEAYIKSWVTELKISDSVIEAAYEKAVANTGKVSFGYMDAILKNPSRNQNVPIKARQTDKKNFFQDYDEEISEFELDLMKKRINKN